MRTRLAIDGIAPGGEGVAHEGRTTPAFVAYTAPGDEVEAWLPPPDPRKPGAIHGELLRVLAPGFSRVDPPCPHFGLGAPASGPSTPVDVRCGGCEWLHLSYGAQLAAKERGLVEALRRIGKLEPGSYPLQPIVPSPEPLRYRSRAKFHLDRASGRLAYFRRRSHEPVRLATCFLLKPGLDALREEAGAAIAAERLPVKEVALEWSEHDGRGAAALHVESVAPAVRAKADALLARVPSLAGIVLLADGATPVLAGDPVLRHERRPGDASAGLQASRPDLFAQANRAANARLVDVALDLLRPDGEDVLELYCGSGNFTAPLAARAAAVQAVEGQGPALDLARAALGGRNVRFYAGDALRLAEAIGRERRKLGAVLLDPPREGARGLGRILDALGASRCVYVSCDPATLARDVRGCVEAGFRVAAARAVDMFPQTHHVEGVVLLERAAA